MLMFTRRPHEGFHIGDEVKVTVIAVEGDQIKLAVDAPKHVKIYREEIWKRIKAQQEAERKASQRAPRGGSGSIRTVSTSDALCAISRAPEATRDVPTRVKRRRPTIRQSA